MKLGLESLMAKTRNELGEDVNVFEALLEMNELETEFDQMDAQFATVETLEDILCTLESLDNVKSAKRFLLSDPSFVDAFGSNEDLWIDSIRNKINEMNKVEPSEEGMKLQDLLRWGLSGVLIGKYLASIGRVTKKLEKNKVALKVMDESKLLNKSLQYLPDYTSTKDIVETLEKLQKAIIDGANIGKVDAKELDKLLASLGIKYNKNSETKTKWSVVGGSVVGGLIGSLLTLPTLGFGALIGHIWGKKMFNGRGKAIGKRGWDKPKVIEMNDRILELFKNTEQFEKAFKNLDKTISVDNQDDLDLYKRYGKVLKTAFKGYRKLMAMIGRGIAAI